MAVASSHRLRARAVSDRSEIAAFLRRDRLYAAYALGDLDGPNRARVSWALATDEHAYRMVSADRRCDQLPKRRHG